VDRFTGPGEADPDRGLGWRTAGGEGREDTPFGPTGFGHTGFTGTSLWVDPGRDLFVVLLTNRVNPTREEDRHVELRRAVHRAIAEAAGGP
jgi:CubicO group peptidase (beta-lactamase class C family)